MNSSQIDQCWDRYIEKVIQSGNNEKTVRWFVIRAEGYLRSIPGKELGEHNPQDLLDYLEDLGRNRKLKDWQFQQTVQAIHILLTEMTTLQWVNSFDWEFWFTSSQELKPDHATLARSNDPLSCVNQNASLTINHDEINKRFETLFKQVKTAIRVRNYSIRTEKSYVGWITRFLAHHGSQDPSCMGPSEVVTFLEYLVINRNVAVSTQNQALNSLVFLYTHVLKLPLGE